MPGADVERSFLSAHELTAEAFEALLAQLHPDRERAAELYEGLRARLLRLFEWRACGDPAALADETLTRMARRVAEGVEIRAHDPFRYAAGVAHFVFKEVLRRAETERAAGRACVAPLQSGSPDVRLRCLDGCLEGLDPGQRELVLGYYEGDGRSRIARRAELAEGLGIDVNALRVRVHRLRQGLEGCLQRCLRGAGNGTARGVTNG